VNGDFSVRSAYHFGVELDVSKGGQCSNSGKEKDTWKTIWALGVPNVVKIFICRACNEVLLTKRNLFRRKAFEIKVCPCCEVEEDDALHALWSCPTAKDVWGCSSSCFQKFCFAGYNFHGLFAYYLERCTKDKAELMAVTARQIWLRRNAWIFEQRFEHPNVVFNETTKSWQEFRRCNLKVLDSTQPVERPEEENSKQSRWLPPPNGVIKVNWMRQLMWLRIGSVWESQQEIVKAFVWE
jgi:hypothetical protein